MAILRLDAMVAIGVGEKGLPREVFTANLIPHKEGIEKKPFEVKEPVPFHSLDISFTEFTEALESEMGRAILRKTKDKRERAILVSVSLGSKEEQESSIKELRSLALTSNINILGLIKQRPKKLNPKYLLGSGKIKELIITALSQEATILIFDSELTPTQIRELGELTELKVIDRTQLILDIFASRAHSRDGLVQVELAQLKYLLPKLSGKGTSMSRLMGGIGGRGPGETKLETDKRRIGERISYLERELKTLGKGRKERRRRRGESQVPIISIVGYTNAGKSTLLNALTKSEVLAEDKLFATLDTTSRRLRFPREKEAIITDTVGFIRNMPLELMRAFRSTLEEMEDADLLLHVVDASDPDLEARIKTVEDILDEVELLSIPRLIVFNKAELIEEEVGINLSKKFEGLTVSAIKPETLKPLVEVIGKKLWAKGGLKPLDKNSS